MCVLRNGGGGCVGRKSGAYGVRYAVSQFIRSLPLLLPLLPFVIGVRGSARAALRARTLSPNTTVCSLFLLFLFSSLLPSSFFVSRLSVFGMAVGVCLPCVGVFGGHDGDG